MRDDGIEVDDYEAAHGAFTGEELDDQRDLRRLAEALGAPLVLRPA